MKKVKGLFWRIVMVLFALLLLYQLWLFAHICWWIKFNPATSAFMEDRLEVMQDKNPKAGLQNKWVPYNKISNNLKRALIAAEDAKFVDHEGFDWEGIAKAYEKNLKKGKIVAGARPSASNWRRTCSSPPNAPHGAKPRKPSSR